MKIYKNRPLSQVQKDFSKEKYEQEITDLEISCIEYEQQLTDHDIEIMEILEKIGEQ